MDGWRRYAVYYAPRPETMLARFGAAWLGWDPERGVEVAGPAVAGLPAPPDEIVAAPARYGLHATLKPPFRLADGARAAALEQAVDALAAELAPVAVRLAPAALGDFVALVPAEPEARRALGRIAAACVRRLDRFRAPPDPNEIARRRPETLTPRQAARLARWGYPFVLDEFAFHLTLTGPLRPDDRAAVAAALEPALGPALAAPAAVEDLCLLGEGADGRFRMLSRRPLAGRA